MLRSLFRLRSGRTLVGVGLIGAFVAVAMASGMLRPVEDGLATMRFALLRRPASQQLTIVEIDVKSLRAAGRWPWGRERFAVAIRNLEAAGATIIGFDVDFSARSSADDDRALAQAIHNKPGTVVLPTFVQPATMRSREAKLVETAPLAALTSDALLASVNVPVDSDGRVRSYQFGFGDAEAYRPSMASMLAGAPHGRTGKFLIDYGVKVDDISRLSFKDVYENRFDRSKVRGRAILVGATALELGDEFATQRSGTLSGVFVHGLAFESLIAGRALLSPHPMIFVVLAWVLAFALRPTRREASILSLVRRHLLAAATLVISPLVLQALAPVSAQIAPLVLSQALCVLWAVQVELQRRAQAIVREREASLLHLAMHEPETEMPNRRALIAELSDRLSSSSQSAHAVVTVGLDRYAIMRGAVGFGLSNRAVCEVAARLACTSQGAMIAHLSTSILGLVVTGEDQAALDAAITGLEALPVSYSVDGHAIDIFLRFGIVYVAAPREDAERLLEQATLALDEARRLNQRLTVFDEQTYVDPSFNLALMSEMTRGLAAGDLSMHYQPKASTADGGIYGAEALVRWKHPQRGHIPPDAFIGTAEETGAIRELTLWTVAQALADSSALRSLGHRLTISVNISGRLLANQVFCEELLAMTRDRGTELCLEITETAVIDNPETAVAAIAQFRAAGIKVSIDDYGVGLSSLSYLKMLHADELKVDKSLVAEVTHNRRDRLILKSTIDLAHGLGMVVVAEGVETHDVQAVLALMGCDIVQGYLISKPLPLDAFETFLADQARLRSKSIVADAGFEITALEAPTG